MPSTPPKPPIARAEPSGRFVFATCAPGLERFLKAEVASRYPKLHLAFSRPGFVTWKLPADAAEGFALGAAFAHVSGASLGRAAGAPEAARLARAAIGEQKARLHVFAREREAEGAALAAEDLERALRGALGELVYTSTWAANGDLVVDVIVHPGEPVFVGVHHHAARRWPAPGGLEAIVAPADAPSRAYAKIEEAIAFGSLDVGEGDVALEIGSAPGGAALALVRRGLHVIGVDPGDMDPRALEERGPGGARLDHRKIPVGGLRWEDLPGKIDWLLLDVNLAPQVALHSIRRLMPRLRRGLRGAVLTLKINELAFVAELPELERRIHELGFRDVVLTHLPSNRKELCALAR